MKSIFTSSFFLCSLLFIGLLVSCNKGTGLEPIDKVNLEEGLEMYFPFDGNSTETITDVTYDTHGATYSHDRFNRPKSSLCLSKNYLNIDVGMGNSLGTLSFWVSIPDTTRYQTYLFAKGNQQLGVLRYGLGVSEGEVSLISDVNRWGSRDSMSSFNPLQTVSIIRPNRWHHIVVRWSDADEFVEIFVDNKLETSAPYLANWFLMDDLEGDSQTMGATWHYGGHDTGDYLSYFKGQVDELRRYNRRISDEEIEALYTIEE
ncbi:LamG-like jellyroll fold domain-containing protein [Olivibacter domesticus]|uniref:Concanavalin A-like lectin/glucanases superfamily protein n=1 Tax=Olivibacter domesticus TaxID=407022 RepID=A0A1H7VEW3_OLID1|nr:LamG-like jellyroll fold domain-containing protein [Olivibacter domesticus]SEM07773.1 Concanavalin A-like lectin/glucanases superfamily protein [Olivibacter domesticus]